MEQSSSDQLENDAYSTRKRRRSDPDAETPQLRPLRSSFSDVCQLVRAHRDEDITKIVCATIASASRSSVKYIAPVFVDSTIETMLIYLTFHPDQLTTFRSRMIDKFSESLNTFLESTFDHELVQVAEAVCDEPVSRQRLELELGQADDETLCDLKRKLESKSFNTSTPTMELSAEAQLNEKRQKKEMLLAKLATKGDVERMAKLTCQAINIDAAHQGGYTALMNAALHGRSMAVSHLIQMGAQLDIQNLQGNTALTLAATCNRLDAVRLLVAAGASLSVKSHRGNTLEQLTTMPGTGARLLEVIQEGLEMATELLKRQAVTATPRPGVRLPPGLQLSSAHFDANNNSNADTRPQQLLHPP